MNESLIQADNINSHFNRQHKAAFLDKHVEFMCKKGRINKQNQDNMFILLDGDVKIIGLFDGHGFNGHQVSSFAQGKMLDFIRNKNGNFFGQKNLETASNDQIKRKIKQAFKYVQKCLKEQYKNYLKQERPFDGDREEDKDRSFTVVNTRQARLSSLGDDKLRQ